MYIYSKILINRFDRFLQTNELCEFYFGFQIDHFSRQLVIYHFLNTSTTLEPNKLPGSPQHENFFLPTDNKKCQKFC
jgi:hypothetical protein